MRTIKQQAESVILILGEGKEVIISSSDWDNTSFRRYIYELKKKTGASLFPNRGTINAIASEDKKTITLKWELISEAEIESKTVKFSVVGEPEQLTIFPQVFLVPETNHEGAE